MTSSTAASISSSVQVWFHEREVLKAVLEFLESRKFHITQLSLERETGLINGEYAEDVLFLRQLILDGQWDSALEFVEPLKDLAEFDLRSFRYAIIKYKYYELLCIKLEPGIMHDNDFAVEEIVECLKELERVCSSGEEFRRLCALLTLPKLSDHEELKSWNPSNARMECFYKVLPLVAELLGTLGPTTAKTSKEEAHASNDRLVQLIAKGLLYEGCVDYCQSQALQGKSAPVPDNKFCGMLPPLPKPRLSSTDLSLVSWLQVLGNEQFTVPFEQKSLEFRLDTLKKPKLEAQWTDQILATPIKPGGQFPHSMVPHAKLKCAQKQIMSQSMVLPCMFSSLALDTNSADPSNRHSNKNLSNHGMSQSTTASIGSFSINPKSNQLVDDQNGDIMKQSQLISNMLEQNSELTGKRPVSLSSSSQTQLPSTPSPSPPAQSSSSGISLNSAPGSMGSVISGSQSMYVASQSRRELDAICRRNQAQAPGSILRQGCLPSVPELATPTNMPNNSFAAAIEGRMESMVDDPMTHSRLFHEFSNRQTLRPSIPVAQQPQQYPPAMQNYSMNAAQGYPPYDKYQHQMQQQVMLQQQTNMMMPANTAYNQPHRLSHQQALPMMRPNPAFQQQQFPPVAPPHLPSQYPNQRPASMVLDGNSQTAAILQSQQRPRSYVDLSSYPARPDSIVEQSAPPQRQDSTDEPIPNNASSIPVNFVPLCRYEDSQAIRAVSFHPSGKYFVVGTNSKQMIVCKYPDLRKINYNKANQSILPPSPEVMLSRPKQHRGSVYCCGFNTNGELLATGSNDKTLRLMSFNAEECKIGAEMELMMHDGTVRELIFMEDSCSPHSSIVVSGGAGNCHICLTDCTTGRTFKSFVGHTAPILGLYSWGPGTCFSSCSQDKTIRFWDLRASNAVNVIMPNVRTSNSPVTSVCIDPSGKLLVSGHEDASVMLYDVIGGRTVQIFRPHGDEVRTVRCSNAAYYLLSGSYDKRVVITDMRGDLTAPLMYLPVAEHADKVIQCRWHPQDFTFLSTSADRTAVLWSLPSSNSSSN